MLMQSLFFFLKNLSFAATLGLEMTCPRTRGGRNLHLDDLDLPTHYRTALFIPFLDNFISWPKQCFELCQNLLSHLKILVPSIVVSVDPKTMNLESFLESHGGILPQQDGLKQEDELWCSKWEKLLITEKPSCGVSSLYECDFTVFQMFLFC